LSYSCRSCCGESLTCLTTTSPLGAESSVDARSGKFHGRRHALRRIGTVEESRRMRIQFSLLDGRSVRGALSAPEPIDQNLHFSFPAARLFTPNRPRWDHFFILSIYAQHVERDGKLLFQEVCERNLEGIVCKRRIDGRAPFSALLSNYPLLILWCYWGAICFAEWCNSVQEGTNPQVNKINDLATPRISVQHAARQLTRL
jgi:hypothetical protein